MSLCSWDYFHLYRCLSNLDSDVHVSDLDSDSDAHVSDLDSDSDAHVSDSDSSDVMIIGSTTTSGSNSR